MNHPYSIRKRLTYWITSLIISANLVTILIGFNFAWREIEEVYDAQLVHSAKVLLQLVQHEIEEDEGFHLGIETPNLEHRYERKIGFRIWFNDQLVTQSNNTLKFEDFEAPPGFSDQIINGQDWRFFVYLDSSRKIKIETSEDLEIRFELTSQILAALLIPAILSLPFIFLTIYIVTRKVMRPVTKLSNDVDRKSPFDLSPIKTTKLASEIAPLVNAINKLLGRMDASLKREREFTDLAAHELRTPLAAMKTQTQVLEKKIGKKPEFSSGFTNLNESINRAAHLVEQLLSLSRLQQESLPNEVINLSKCIIDTINMLKIYTDQKQIIINAKIAPNLVITGYETAIILLLKNLVDNAIKYSPSNSEIEISLKNDGKFVIKDNGPGIPDALKSSVFKRFVRNDKTGQAGSGLGLSIVSWVANYYHIDVKLKDNKPIGLKVIINWPIKDAGPAKQYF